MKGLLRRRGAGQPIPLHCVEHEVDLAAMRRFLADGRPAGLGASIESILWGECPACIPRYLAGNPQGDDEPADQRRPDALALLARPWPRPGGPLECECCGSSWDLAQGGWVAEPGDGLRAGAAGSSASSSPDYRQLPASSIDSGHYRVEPIEARDAAATALWLEFVEFELRSGRLAGDDLVDDLVESMVAAFGGRADARAELARIAAEHRLDSPSAEAWRDEALAALSVLHQVASVWNAPGAARPVVTLARTGPLGPEEDAAAATIGQPRFEQLVAETLDALPARLAAVLGDVPIIVEDEPAAGGGGSGDWFTYEARRPAPRSGQRIGTRRLILYRGPICRQLASEEEVRLALQRIVTQVIARRLRGPVSR